MSKIQRLITFEKLLDEYITSNTVEENDNMLRFKYNCLDMCTNISSIIDITMVSKKQKNARTCCLFPEKIMEKIKSNLETHKNSIDSCECLVPDNIEDAHPKILIMCYIVDKIGKHFPYSKLSIGKKEFVESIVKIVNFTHK